MILFHSGFSSTGTISLAQNRLLSTRTIAALGVQAQGADTEVYFTLGVSVTTLNLRSGNTTYYWASSANTTT